MQRPFRFRPPDLGATTVVRPRLLAPLAARFERRIVTVRAGAGLGKTTLLAQACHENQLDPRGRDHWFTCEPADSSATTFAGALLHALGAPDVETAPSVRDICEAVWSAAPEPVCLVVDDVQHIELGSSGETVLVELLEQLPDNGHLLVAGRRMPALPLARLTVDGRAIELDEDDLRFNAAELESFASTHGVTAGLLDGLGGWPALAELRARTRAVQAERYAWEEVIAPLADVDRAAFLLLVALGGADVPSLGVVLGRRFDAHVLAGLPLVATDDHGGLRPHAIWEGLVREHIDPGSVADARTRMAALLREQGDPGGAFELLAANGAWDDALDTLFAACNDQARPPWPDQMDRWRRLVPDELADRPEVTYAVAMVGRATDPWSEETAQQFDMAIEGFRARGLLVCELIAMVRASYLAWVRCDLRALSQLRARTELLADTGLPVDALLRINRLSAVDIAGEGIDAAPSLAADELEPRLRHVAGIFRSYILLGDGHADAAVVPAAEAAEYARPVHPAAVTALAAFAPAAVAWARGDLESVERELPADPGPRYPIAERVPPAALAVIVAAHTGATATAHERLDALDRLLPDVGPRDLLAGFRAIAGAAVAVAEHDEDAATGEFERLLRDRDLCPGGAGRALLWWPALPYLLHAASRAFLDAHRCGPSRTRVLDAARALRSARAGERFDVPALIVDPPALLAALPAPLASELVAFVAACHPATAVQPTLAFVARRAPDVVRASLRLLCDDDRAGVARAARTLLGTVPIPPPHRVRVELLGSARLLRDGEPVDDSNWRRQRVRQLLCALVAYRHLPRAQLGALLWPDLDADGVSANLRMTLSYLQTLLEPTRGRGDATWFLRQDAGVLQLAGDDRLEIDVWELDEHLGAAERARAAGTPSLELAHLLDAVELWRGDPLQDVAGEEWADPFRERARQRFLHGAVRAGELLLAAGRHTDAARVAEVALWADVYAEAAYRVLVRARLGSGDRDAARRAFDMCRAQLDELGVAPEPVTAALGAELR